jgi:hypothetical protein
MHNHSHLTAYLGTSTSTTCPVLEDCLHTYEQLYIDAIKKTLDKYDCDFCTGGKYAVEDTLQRVHIPVSTHSVECTFSTTNWLLTVHSPSLHTDLLSAYIASHKAPSHSLCMDHYLLAYGVQHPPPPLTHDINMSLTKQCR